MQIALTGISGFIGSVLARHLSQAGHQVVGLIRSSSRRDHIEPYTDRLVVAAQDDNSVWPELLEGTDAVVHNSADFSLLRERPDIFDQHLQSNLIGSIRLLRAAAPRPFVFISSVAVHHDMKSRWEGRIDEDHPLRPSTWYGAYKAAVEAHLWTAWHRQSQPTFALRPAAVYGPDPKIERAIGHPFIEQIREGRAFDRAGGGKFVHVDDVAAATLACLNKPQAAGQAFNLADCYARWADWAAIVAELVGVEIDIDFSSPPASANVFVKDQVHRVLGVELDRGMEGIRQHLRELIGRVEQSASALQ